MKYKLYNLPHGIICNEGNPLNISKTEEKNEGHFFIVKNKTMMDII